MILPVIAFNFSSDGALAISRMKNEIKKKEIPYKEGKMKDIGARVGYTVLWGRISKIVWAGVQMCYYPAAPLFYVMAVLSGTRVVRVLWMVMAASTAWLHMCASGLQPSVLGHAKRTLVVPLLDASCS